MKNYNIQNNIGKAKYVVNFHDGEKTHKDGSLFWDIKVFKTKQSRMDFVKELNRQGYSGFCENFS